MAGWNVYLTNHEPYERMWIDGVTRVQKRDCSRRALEVRIPVHDDTRFFIVEDGDSGAWHVVPKMGVIVSSSAATEEIAADIAKWAEHLRDGLHVARLWEIWSLPLAFRVLPAISYLNREWYKFCAYTVRVGAMAMTDDVDDLAQAWNAVQQAHARMGGFGVIGVEFKKALRHMIGV